MRMFPKTERIYEGHISVFVRQVMLDIYSRMDLSKIMAAGGPVADYIQCYLGDSWRDIKPHPMRWVYLLPRETFKRLPVRRFVRRAT